MKRWFSLALVALFLVPVLAVGVSASEIYEFEYFERPAILADDFSFSFMEGNVFLCPSELSEGIYTFTVSSPSLSFVSSPVDVRYVYDPEVIEYPHCYFILLNDDISYQSGLLLQEGTTLFISPLFDDRYTITAERVGDLPSQGGFDSLLGDVSSFTGSCFSSVTKVADTITGSPFLLLTVGILFIGGCIGVSGRLFSRR